MVRYTHHPEWFGKLTALSGAEGQNRRIDLITLFPDMFIGPLNESMLKRAVEKGKVKIFIHNLRDFGIGKHRTCDDRPYGGGPGMVLKPEPIWRALKVIEQETKGKKGRIILLSPQGEIFTQEKAKRLAKERHLIFICGHYEGVDERIYSLVDEEISIGNYILTGGEIPALVLVDSIVRLLPGVVAKKISLRSESFSEKFLDYPQYTRPRVWQGKRVPMVLFSGHHKKISLWRKEQAMKNTYLKRPDLFAKIHLTEEEKRIYEKLKASVLRGSARREKYGKIS